MLLFLSSSLAAAWVEAWLEGLLLLLALAGPASDLKNALLHCSLGCLLPTVPDPHRKQKYKKNTGMERSGSTPSALCRARLPCGSRTGGAPTAAAESHSCWTGAGTYVRAGLYWFVLYAFRRRLRAWPGEGVGGRAAGRRVCFLRLSPPASGLARRRRAAQLDGDISFHSSRRRLRDWPCGGAEGRAAGRGILLCASRHRLRAWPGWGGGGARRWARSLLFYASCRRLRAWPGWGGGGVRCLGVELAFLSFTHWPLDGRPSYARSLVPTPSKTVDQTPPP